MTVIMIMCPFYVDMSVKNEGRDSLSLNNFSFLLLISLILRRVVIFRTQLLTQKLYFFTPHAPTYCGLWVDVHSTQSMNGERISYGIYTSALYCIHPQRKM